MKKLIIAALAASILSTPVLAAPNHQGNGRYEQSHRQSQSQSQRHGGRDTRIVKQRIVKQQIVRQRGQQRDWHRGERFDYRQARDYRVISAPRNYRLYDAPRGYRWVQSGNDAVLVGITSGVIAAIMANMIR